MVGEMSATKYGRLIGRTTKANISISEDIIDVNGFHIESDLDEYIVLPSERFNTLEQAIKFCINNVEVE